MTNDNQQMRVYLEEAHVRRVAAWCAEIAAKLELPPADRQALECAARLHHQSNVVLNERSWLALRQDLVMGASLAEETPRFDTVMEILQAFHGNRRVPEQIRKLGRILEQCDDLDSACELDASLSAEPLLNGLDGIVGEVNGYFSKVEKADLDRAASRMPVFDTIAYRAIGLLGNESASLAEVERLVAADQTVAGHIVSAANSVLRGSTTMVRDLRQAITRVGMAPARQIISAVCFRRLFEARHSRSLWNHSLDVAEAAASIAGRSGLVDSEQAFLAGLTHHIGKLVILNLPTPPVARQERLRRGGCPDPIVEQVILGEDHGSIGGRLLRNWRFDEGTAGAVENHHTPERNESPLCQVLYLAQLSGGRDLGLDSAWREELASDTLKLTSSECQPPSVAGTVTSGLRFTAAA